MPFLFAAAAWAQSPTLPEEWVALARERALRGDWEGVVIAANHATGASAPVGDDAVWLLVHADEQLGHPDRALARVDGLIADWDQAIAPDDLTFRRADLLWQLGRWADARLALATIDHPDERSPHVRLQLSVLDALIVQGLGDPTLATRKLVEALDAAAPGDAPEWQARAHRALVDIAVIQADAMPLGGSERRRRRAMEGRQALLLAAAEHLAPIVTLERTPHGLAAILRLTQGLASLADAVEAQAPLPGRSDAKDAAYAAACAQRARELRLYADQLAARGEEFALRMAWEGPEIGVLRDARASIAARIVSP